MLNQMNHVYNSFKGDTITGLLTPSCIFRPFDNFSYISSSRRRNHKFANLAHLLRLLILLRDSYGEKVF